MAQTVIVCPEDRERLLAIIGDRNRPFKQIQRAKIVLFSAERLPVLEVARRADRRKVKGPVKKKCFSPARWGSAMTSRKLIRASSFYTCNINVLLSYVAI